MQKQRSQPGSCFCGCPPAGLGAADGGGAAAWSAAGGAVGAVGEAGGAPAGGEVSGEALAPVLQRSFLIWQVLQRASSWLNRQRLP